MSEQAGKSQLDEIEEAIGHTFEKRDLLEEALTHASMKGSGSVVANERLAFLGDAVLGLAAAHLLYDDASNLSKGALTEARKDLVNNTALAAIARRKNLGRGLRLGKGEAHAGPEKESILASLVEAVIGAVYLDAGYDAAFTASMSLLGPQN